MGCKYVIMGSQTVNEGSRAPEVINRTESSEEIAAAVRRLKDQGIFVLLDHIFGIPGEALDDQEAALRFYIEAGADVIKPFFLSYFPGTDLSKRAEAGIDSSQGAESEEHWDHFMFKGRLSEQDYAAYNLAYALFPLLGERGRKTMLKAGLHHKFAQLGRLPGLGNIILFPRLAASLFSQRDIRPKLYLNYLRTILRYEIRSHLHERRA